MSQHAARESQVNRVPCLVDPDEGASQGHANALHQVPNHVQHGPSQVYAFILPAMAVAAMAVAVAWAMSVAMACTGAVAVP